jgi:hypothetical protein
MHVGGIFCGLPKAFDPVNHEILLANLQCYGIQGVCINWFRSCLRNSKQKDEIKAPKETQNFFSHWNTLQQRGCSVLHAVQ